MLFVVGVRILGLGISVEVRMRGNAVAEEIGIVLFVVGDVSLGSSVMVELRVTGVGVV